MKKAVIYQLVVRYFGNTKRVNKLAGTIEENGCGKFDDINDKAIKSLADMGITHVWLTGILRQATLTDYAQFDRRLAADPPDIVKGRAGSFYAVKDYVDVCPDYITNKDNLRTPVGRLSEFKALVDRLHAHGLKVLIDYVPNHVSRAYQSYLAECNFGAQDNKSKAFDRDNNFYYYPGQRLSITVDPTWKQRVPNLPWTGTYVGEDGATPDHVLKLTGDLDVGKEDPARPNSDRWYEGAKLNYGMDIVGNTGNHYDSVPRTWKMVDRIIQFWQDQGVDGFRCDMAYYVPDEFWRFLIEKARGRKDVYFVAEGYERQNGLIDAGFDAVYHFQAYNALVDIYRGAPLERYSDELSNPFKDRSHLLNYIENHDEARVTTLTRSNGKSGFSSAKANYQLAPLHLLAYDGPVMIYNGQEVGQLPDQTNAGFASAADGRTTFFDYWCMPEVADWVNGHEYDGGRLNPEQKKLRNFFCGLLALCQDAAVCAPNFWGLRYSNNSQSFLSYARYQYKSERLLLVVANFRYQSSETGNIRLPAELTRDIGWRYGDSLSVSLLLDQNGKPANGRKPLGTIHRATLEQSGLPLTIPMQDCWVVEITK